LVIWYIFSPFWYIVQRTIWQPWSRTNFTIWFAPETEAPNDRK
jgi:hypothetical protein